MSSSLMTSSGFRFLFPIALLGMVSVGMGNIIQMTQSNWGIAANLPYILLGCALVLCYSFKQGRESMVCLSMLVAYFVIQHRLQVPLNSGTALLELTILATLLPVSFLTVFLFNKDGFDSKAMFIYVLMLVMFILWSYIILAYYVDGGFEQWTSGILFIVPSVSKLPFILVLYCVGIVCFLGILLLKTNKIIHAMTYSAMALASATFIFFDVQYISSTMFTLTGLLIIIYSTSASHQLAFTDSLTQIPSRRALDLDLKHMGRKFTIAMLDVDHFKKFNDTYGHDIGDDVLKMVASRLMKTRGGAKIYRFGGEEFTMVFKGKNVEDCRQYIEEARKAIAEYEMILRDKTSRPDDHKQGQQNRGTEDMQRESVFVTASFGAADSRNGREPAEVIKLADAALYKAKKAGRNCTRVNQN
ncbi:GGDEF domain-containing protein [Vibrio parahaemolyticus]|uniref:GGDEF domain-containing protein n=1 Tax=Vibrio parahaemolyticus TaxID=670 RepID=UPI001121516C|nr:GGDEF domain-containing protein [Vibrio parahaemolyticus]TOD65140.1 GGDEF domain-containing protein [Vibrio parahaemolyticus]